MSSVRLCRRKSGETGFPGNRGTRMEVRFRRWEEEGNRGRSQSRMETDEKQAEGALEDIEDIDIV